MSTFSNRWLGCIAYLRRIFWLYLICVRYGEANSWSISMPTFLIFRSGTIIKTIRGADPRALESAIKEAVKLAAAAKPTYSSAGYTLGGGPSTQQHPSVARPWSWDFTRLWEALISFIGLYFISLFSVSVSRSTGTLSTFGMLLMEIA